MEIKNNAPLRSRQGAENTTHINYNSFDPLIEVTSRLKGVIRRSNGGILAFCPSHDDRKGRSLAVSTGRESQVLLHCFAGCSVSEIANSIGLNLADLFPRSDSPNYEPHTRSYFNDWQIISSLKFDSLVVLSAARTMLRGEMLAETDVEFLSKAVVRIHEAASYSRGARHE